MRWTGIDVDSKIVSISLDFEDVVKVLKIMRETELFGEHTSLTELKPLLDLTELSELTKLSD